jgi:hypothetical protein
VTCSGGRIAGRICRSADLAYLNPGRRDQFGLGDSDSSPPEDRWLLPALELLEVLQAELTPADADEGGGCLD